MDYMWNVIKNRGEKKSSFLFLKENIIYLKQEHFIIILSLE